MHCNCGGNGLCVCVCMCSSNNYNMHARACVRVCGVFSQFFDMICCIDRTHFARAVAMPPCQPVLPINPLLRHNCTVRTDTTQPPQRTATTHAYARARVLCCGVRSASIFLCVCAHACFVVVVRSDKWVVEYASRTAAPRRPV